MNYFKILFLLLTIVLCNSQQKNEPFFAFTLQQSPPSLYFLTLVTILKNQSKYTSFELMQLPRSCLENIHDMRSIFLETSHQLHATITVPTFSLALRTEMLRFIMHLELKNITPKNAIPTLLLWYNTILLDGNQLLISAAHNNYSGIVKLLLSYQPEIIDYKIKHIQEKLNTDSCNQRMLNKQNYYNNFKNLLTRLYQKSTTFDRDPITQRLISTTLVHNILQLEGPQALHCAYHNNNQQLINYLKRFGIQNPPCSDICTPQPKPYNENLRALSQKTSTCTIFNDRIY